MASVLEQVSFAALVPGYTTIDQKTITIIAQLSISAGNYTRGGIPAGVAALARSLTVDDATFLNAFIQSELTVPASGHTYLYKYIPSTDKIQIFDVVVTTGTQAAPVELAESAATPAGVLTDVIVGEFTYNRL